MFRTPKSFVDPPPPHTHTHTHKHTYKLYLKYPMEVDSVPLGSLIAELPRMVFAFMRNMSRKFMVGLAFVNIFPT